MDLLGTRWVDPVRQSPRRRAYGYFTHGTDPPPCPFLIWFSGPSQPSSPAAFPGPHPPPVARSRGFHRACGTTQPSVYWCDVARHFACAYRLAYSGAAGDRASPPEVTPCTSIPCRPQTPWYGG